MVRTSAGCRTCRSVGKLAAMKSRWTISLLLAAVVAVWGLVAWKILTPGREGLRVAVREPSGRRCRHVAARLSGSVPESRGRPGANVAAAGPTTSVRAETSPPRTDTSRAFRISIRRRTAATYSDSRRPSVRTAAIGFCCKGGTILPADYQCLNGLYVFLRNTLNHTGYLSAIRLFTVVMASSIMLSVTFA